MSHSALGLGALVGALPALLALVFLFARFSERRVRLCAVHRAAFEQDADSVLLLDARTLRVIDASQALLRSLNYTHEELCRLPLTAFLEEGTEPGSLLRKLTDPRTSSPLELRQRSKGGQVRAVDVSAHRFEAGGRPLVALTLNDGSARRQLEAELLARQSHLDHLAHHDPLTGLPNRHFLLAHLPGAIEQARLNGVHLAVLFLDLDRFKHINDSRGHDIGDKMLNVVAERLSASVPASDLVVRMGGDEFVVVLRSFREPDTASEIAARIKETLSLPMMVEGRAVMSSASIGVSLYPRDGADLSELLRNADTAMYHAKEQGRNNFQIFTPAMGRRLEERIAIESSLRTALQRRQLEVHYQPIVDIHSHRVVALECLLRWKHPAYGFVSPDRFIAIAEETGLIVPMGEFVLERVIEDIACWQAAGCTPVPVALNISAVQLQRSDLPETIAQMTRIHGVSPHMLQVELTESAAFEREANEDAVARLRALGVQIAIDDFGTGYSSLSYLKRWRVDFLKIDRSFVRDLVTDTSDLAIVGAIIAMARHLNIEIVAEGIESWPQLEKLQELGSTFAQGYLFAKPAPAEQCKRYLLGDPLTPMSTLSQGLDPSPGLALQPLAT